jgi:hypothetical protein
MFDFDFIKTSFIWDGGSTQEQNNERESIMFFQYIRALMLS